MRWPQIALLFASFALYSAVRAPVPSVNEPHYLVKARNFWQPEWCAGDLFLDSANPHVVFYATIGWLTSVMSLASAAVAGRAIALLLLAIGWDRLLSRILPGRWGPLTAAWIFLLLQTWGNFAGEWLVGGVESKVVSYAFVLWGCGECLAGRRILAGILLGAAVSFHPVVGAWCLLCVAGAGVRRTALSTFRRRDVLKPGAVRATSIHSLRLYWPAIACGVVTALPGLIPAARLLSQPNPATALRADIIQVAIRLDHHLDPYMFPWSAYVYYALLIGTWLILRRYVPRTGAWQLVEDFTWMALAIAAAGWLAAAGPRPITHLPGLDWRIKLLKLYPFRVADLAVPFMVAVTVADVAASQFASASRRRRTLISYGLAAAFAVALLLPGIDQNPSRMTGPRRSDWIAVLRWIDSSTPKTSLLWAADEDWAVKWFSERPEYVNFKDCPQDASGIIEWYERRVKLAEWKRAAAGDGRFTAEELAALRDATGITHVIASRMGPVDASPAFENGSFRIYTLTDEVRGGE